MKPLYFTILIVFFVVYSTAFVVDPIVDTDQSVNTHSVQTIVADLIEPGMTDEEKLLALFSYHRRMMHHFRLQQSTEDNNSTFDLIKLYTVYGCSWCTQQAVVFRQLVEAVFGYNSVRVVGGSGPLATHDREGGHSSFEVRFDYSDDWHWIDPIIGAFVRSRGDGHIASLDEILADSLFVDAKSQGRTSVPYFPCNAGDPLDEWYENDAAYTYYDYDSDFMLGFADGYESISWAHQNPIFNTGKILKKGESYIWLWDFLDGQYHNFHDKTPQGTSDGGLSRDAWIYPPRHVCGWKDSLDTINWPYFKPYAREIKGDTVYRYYANGFQRYQPDLFTGDPKDNTFGLSDVDFYVDDSLRPALRPSQTGKTGSLAYKFILPYPVMSLKLRLNYTKRRPEDSLNLYMARVYFEKAQTYVSGYLDRLSMDSLVKIKTLDTGEEAVFDTLLRSFIDPAYMPSFRTNYGYMFYIRMHATHDVQDVGLDSLMLESIFQHNMFHLPQLEPGDNQVTLISDHTSLEPEHVKVGFGWMEGDSLYTDWRDIHTAGQTYTVAVNQSDMPRMKYMVLGNTRQFIDVEAIGVEEPVRIAAAQKPKAEMRVCPNPFNPRTHIHFELRSTNANYQHSSLRIFNARGRLVDDLSHKISNSTFDIRHSISWNASGLPSGVYLIKATAGNRVLQKKAILLR